ncbi:hypothetical protein PGT21_027466 [Puccinia graminis f. sp. tritici]|uniref:Uncharacterized protein n=1 Tax=Puccinia graminis f. sp. tritici TaxID=56615 RepID=A0A5B0MFV2_PUCGR|nr:hypothetical protein PGT21_027466 [Puccinia graminis f. sp. tritici]
MPPRSLGSSCDSEREDYRHISPLFRFPCSPDAQAVHIIYLQQSLPQPSHESRVTIRATRPKRHDHLSVRPEVTAKVEGIITPIAWTFPVSSWASPCLTGCLQSAFFPLLKSFQDPVQALLYIAISHPCPLTVALYLDFFCAPLRSPESDLSPESWRSRESGRTHE